MRNKPQMLRVQPSDLKQMIGAVMKASVAFSVIGLVLACGSSQINQNTNPILLAKKDVSTGEDRQSVSLTIYNFGIGLVRETRRLPLDKGITELNFMDVAEKIIPQSVRISDPQKKVTVYEQNFEFDLVTPSRLMDKFIGKEVTIYNEHPTTGIQTPRKVTLIANNKGPVYQTDTEISLGYPGRVTVPQLPNNLFTKPTMVWKLTNEKAGETELEVMYQTSGMGWSSDYVMVLSDDEKTAGMNCWVTLTNQSGAEFKNATLQLVAGQINFTKTKGATVDALDGDSYLATLSSVTSRNKTPEFEQENLSEMYLYTLDTPTDLNNNQTKQLQLFTGDQIQIEKRYEIQQVVFNDSRRFTSANIWYEFINSNVNSLGRPMPKGVVRVYKADSKGRQQLLGESGIDHTPQNEKIKLHTGKAFDVVSNGRILYQEQFDSGRGNKGGFEVSVRNRKAEAITVRVFIQKSPSTKIIKTSHPVVVVSTISAYMDIYMRPDSEEVVSYHLETKYN